MGRVRRVAAVWLCGLGLAAVVAPQVAAQGATADPLPSPPLVGAVAVEGSDEPVLVHLQDILGYSPRRHASELAADREALLAAARADGEQQLVVVDGARGRVEVIRVGDGTTLWRELPAPAERSPYAVAFVAAELLHLSMQAGAAAADTGAQAAAPDARTGSSLGFLLTAGAELRGNADLLYFRPALELGVSLHDRDSSLWLVAAVRAALFGSASHTQDGQRLELSQHDVGLGVGVGLRGRRFGLLGLLRGGIAIAAWELQGAPGSADSQLRGWLGAALRGHVNIVRSLGFFAEAGFALTPLRSRYIGPDGVLLEPGRVDAVVLLGLSWDTGG